MILAATGHRPKKLGSYHRTHAPAKELAIEYLSAERPDKIITGMALGWDQAVADAAIELNIPFIAAIPFLAYEHYWPGRSRERYLYFLEHASEKIIINREPEFNVNRVLQERNEWMVDHADKMLALWDGTFSGTWNCLKYAKKKNVPVENLWDKWLVKSAGLHF